MTLLLGVALSCQSAPPKAPEPAAAGPAAVTAAPTPPRLRLDGTARPRGYELELALDPTADVFRGVMDIDLDLQQPTAVVWMHGQELTVERASLSPGPGAGAGQAAALVAQPVTTPAEQGFLGFALPRVVPAGPARLHIEYRGPLSARDNDGLFRQRDRDSWYVFTDFEPTDARRAFPCFDEPLYKVPWQLSVVVPRDQVALANTPVESETDAGSGQKRVRFLRTRPLPSYLVALAVGPFEVVDAGQARKSHAPLRVITPKGRAGEARYIAEVSAEILSRLEDYFGVPYPYEKLDQIAVPEFHGAMENPGLITYSQNTLLSPAEDDSVRRQRGVAETAAHEMAHQWFGDLVTMKYWDDLWLNESFASWMGTRVIDEWQPRWDMPVDRVHTRAGAIRRDSLRSARRIRQPIESSHDIHNAFDSITYNKGQAVLEMFERYLGAERFRAGVRRHLQAHAYGNADAAEFLQALSAEDPTIEAALRTFLDQPGVPLLQAELSCKNGPARLLLRQSRFLLTPAEAQDEKVRWQVPVCARWAGGGRGCTLLKEAQGELALPTAGGGCPAWVLPNEGGVGYYRVRYRGDLLPRLMKDGGQALTVAERVSVLEDAGALVRAGEMPAAELLSLLPGLAGDPSRHIVEETLGIVGALRRHLVPAELRPNYARLLRKLYGPKARALGLAPKKGEDEGTHLLRPMLFGMVADAGEDPQLRAAARRATEAWLADRGAISPEMVGVTLSVAARAGDAALFDKLVAAARASRERRERGRLLRALSSFGDPALYGRALGLILDGGFDIRESVDMLHGGGHSDATALLAYQYVKDHFDALRARLPQNEGTHLMSIGGFCDEVHRADLQAFFGPRAAGVPGGPRVLRQIVDGIGVCVAMRSKQADSVAGFLRKF